MPEEDTNTIKSVQRSFRILDRILENGGCGVNELARDLEYSPSTVHAHLTTLHDLGFLVVIDGDYDLSNRFLYFSTYARDRVEGFDVIERVVGRLAEETDERVQFMIEEHGRGIYIEEAEGDRGAPNDSSLGEPRYLHMCAAGKAILANLPQERVIEIIGRWGLPKQTDNTICDRETLISELETVREQGFATNIGETVKGLNAIAAPVLSAENRVIGSISVSGPAHRISMDGEVKDAYCDQLIGAIEDIELHLTYT